MCVRLGGGETPKIDAELGQYTGKKRKKGIFFFNFIFPLKKEEKAKGAKFKKKGSSLREREKKRYDFSFFSPLIVSPKEEKGNRTKK